MLKHQPFGWLIFKKTLEYEHISHISVNTPYLRCFTECTFVDSTPFGIKEE